jgi:hypothetical protein
MTMTVTYSEIWDIHTNAVSTAIIKKTVDGDPLIYIIPNDSRNSDWIAYQEWRAAGNKPLKIEPPPPPGPTLQEEIAALKAMIESMKIELDEIKRNT